MGLHVDVYGVLKFKTDDSASKAIQELINDKWIVDRDGKLFWNVDIELEEDIPKGKNYILFNNFISRNPNGL